jgi:prophage antirepressor-like protein
MKAKAKSAIIYQAKNGAIEFRGDLSRETIWATQTQIADVFGVERSVVTKHIRNILKTREIDEKSNVQKMHIANSDKPVSVYSLDIILSTGYRTNSNVAIEFRKWATKTLHAHITKGYTLNRKRIANNYGAFMQSVADVQTLLPEHTVLNPQDVIDLIKEFASTWISLDAYDKELPLKAGSAKKKIRLTGEELVRSIESFRAELLRKGEVTEIFAQERTSGSIEGIVGNVMQSFGGKDVYPTLEEKAAHMLYFVVKNHPFTDGNKRSGAFSFVWFLRKYRSHGGRKINPAALTALTLLIAESNPKKKHQMISLVTRLLL